MPIQYQVIRSHRRTVAIEITGNRQVLVRCPYALGEEKIREMVMQKQAWIQKQLKKPLPEPEEQLSLEQKELLRQEAAKVIPERVAKLAPLVGVTYENVSLRFQKTRWGSCSGKGNLSFNCLLLLAPEAVRDYVVIHELCHRKEMNHSPKFWAEV